MPHKQTGEIIWPFHGKLRIAREIPFKPVRSSTYRMLYETCASDDTLDENDVSRAVNGFERKWLRHRGAGPEDDWPLLVTKDPADTPAERSDHLSIYDPGNRERDSAYYMTNRAGEYRDEQPILYDYIANAPGITHYAEAILDAVGSIGVMMTHEARGFREQLYDDITDTPDDGHVIPALLGTYLTDRHDRQAIVEASYTDQFLSDMYGARDRLVSLVEHQWGAPEAVEGDTYTIQPVADTNASFVAGDTDTTIPVGRGPAEASVKLTGETLTRTHLGVEWRLPVATVTDAGTGFPAPETNRVVVTGWNLARSVSRKYDVDAVDPDTRSFVGRVDRFVYGEVRFSVVSSEDDVEQIDHPWIEYDELPDATVGDRYECEMDPDTSEVVEATLVRDDTAEPEERDHEKTDDPIDEVSDSVDDNQCSERD